jgi:CHAT domain-containing protein/tetratricopeptide (TPR) repeat protein
MCYKNHRLMGSDKLIGRWLRGFGRRFLVSSVLLLFSLAITISPAVSQNFSVDLFQGKARLATSKNIIKAAQLQDNGQQNSTQKTKNTALLEQGKLLFAAGRLVEAGEIWQQAAQGYDAEGNHLEQARSLNYLALTYLNLGEWSRAQNAIAKSLSFLKRFGSLDKEKTSLLAQSLNTQGNIYLVLGKTQTALDTWQESAINYRSIDDITGMLGSQINVAKALQSLGKYRRSQTILEQTLAQLQNQPDATVKSIGLGMLGVAKQALGDLNQAKELLEQSLALSQQLEKNNPIIANRTSATLLSLGNTLAALQQTEAALARYQQAATSAPNSLTRTEAQLNQLNLLLKVLKKKCPSTVASCQKPSKNSAIILSLVPQIQSNLDKLAPSRESIYARVNFAASLMQLSSSNNDIKIATIAQLVATAVQQARTLQDLRAEAYALGQLAHLYEYSSQWQEAKKLSEQAITIAQKINAPDITALLQWQLGRILKQQNKQQEAIAAYQNSVYSLQSLRQEIVALTPDLQFSFTESIEPVYRELVALLLEFSPDQTNLTQARELIEALQLAELDNFFREACLKAKPQRIDQVDPKAAVIYPIVLPDRIAVIVSPGKDNLFYYETKLPKAELEKVIEQLRLYLNPHFFEEDRLRLSQQVYDWLIRPAETKLAQNKVETLVFVLDDALRNLPMAALHDGKQYLVEKYSIALTPGLQLLESKMIAPKQVKVLVAGLSKAQLGFSALPAVEYEVNQIAAKVSSSILLNQNFTLKNIKDQIDQVAFGIVHIATHGQFSSKAQETFLVAWDGKINVKDLNDLLRERDKKIASPIELLVLSACQTATGDKKATLGLAGFAVRSGARSTLATLWQVNDESTAELMVGFYRQLIQNPGISKAKALQTAQIELSKQPKYQHPFYWASFVLVGNWL